MFSAREVEEREVIVMQFFAWMFVLTAGSHLVNVYRHATRDVSVSRWGGASAAGQACLACGSLGLGALCVVPKGDGSPVVWGVVVVALVAMFLGTRIENHVMSEADLPESKLKRAVMGPLRLWH